VRLTPCSDTPTLNERCVCSIADGGKSKKNHCHKEKPHGYAIRSAHRHAASVLDHHTEVNGSAA